MVWQERSVMDQRREFVALAQAEGVNIRELCRRSGISAKTGYKWIGRVDDRDPDWAANHSRRPRSSPTRTDPQIEARVVELRLQHPSWGGRKLAHRLRTLGVDPVPAPSTITDILRRHDLLAPYPASPRTWHRLTHPVANALWQMDFMGPFPTTTMPAHPLTLIDDHSRFALGVWACPHQRGWLVREHLSSCFRGYGMPAAMLTDNGPPWGTAGRGGITKVEAWLLRLGIRVAHGRPYHPQTQGKVERFHRTLAVELTRTYHFAGLDDAQRAIDHWRLAYNTERPHQALDYAVPADHYQLSPIPFPEVLPPVIYDQGDAVRKVRGQGSISWQNQIFFISRGLIGEPVAVRPTTTDGIFRVFYCHQQVSTLDLRNQQKV